MKGREKERKVVEDEVVTCTCKIGKKRDLRV